MPDRKPARLLVFGRNKDGGQEQVKYIVDIEKFIKLCEGREQYCTKCPFFGFSGCHARRFISDSPRYEEGKTDGYEKILLEERLKHLLESRFIKSFDEIDYLTGKYKRDIKEADKYNVIFEQADINPEPVTLKAKAKEEKPDTVPGRVQGKLLASAMAAVFGQRIRDAIKEGGHVEYNFSSGIITIYGKTEDEKK